MSSYTLACLKQVKENSLYSPFEHKRQMIFCRYKHTLLQSISPCSFVNNKRTRLLMIRFLSVIKRYSWTKKKKRVHVKCHTVCFIHIYNIYLTKTSMKLICHFFCFFEWDSLLYIWLVFRQKSFNWMIPMKKILLLYNHLTSLDWVQVLVLRFL